MGPSRPSPLTGSVSAVLGAALVATLAGTLLAPPPASAAGPAPAPVTAVDAPADARDTRGFPRRTVLDPPPVNGKDASLKLGLAPYHSLAPRLNALQRLGDRVSVEVAGRSAGGHELYLVTVTAPESAAEAREQERMRERIENAPASAAKDPRIRSAYKTPVFLNNNIHGNEWEGTDAALRLIERLAKAADAGTSALLAKNRVHINVTANPDGRIAGTRANSRGFDLNRDFITASQPETRAVRRIAAERQPALMLDLHGYVNGTLIEPTTPPHGENYEYDLFLKNAYRNALGMEQAVNALGYTEDGDGVKPPVIPFRDQKEGWDDWPPLFTPQYMPFQGAVASHTVEFPLRVNNAAYEKLPVRELRRRAEVNTRIAGAAMRATLDYARRHRTSVIADQIETFRRGAAGEAQRPVSEETVPGVPGIGPEDVYTTRFPRAYVIPAGGGGRSPAAAARLVDHLVANDVRVERARADFRLGGRGYRAGSYLVDMHQPKRGLANVILADGRDISDDVSAMYDISGWSLGLLWGARVDAVERGAPRVPADPVRAAARDGGVAARGDLRLRLDDPYEVAALNSLLAQGVRARRTDDGAAVLPGSARGLAREAAARFGVTFGAAGERGTAELRRTRVAAAVTPGERFALREMGFAVTPVSTERLNAGFDWSGTDALLVSSGLDHGKLTRAAREAFAESGVGVVGVGAEGAAFNEAASLLPVTGVRGNGDANGVVRVRNAGGPLTAGAPPHSFVYAPGWFTGLGDGVRVEQSYAGDGPLVSGHWRAGKDGAGGPGDAAGRPSVVSGSSASGAPVVLFGTEPMYRAHPKGLYAQAARALLTR
ncbi:M14 family zinc carboxypeptidase [Streptomyces sp. HNM0574]|uniref:M14 family zinc carboxypeptidase n=1 Tax=Streptomyces sp. HNM0574 TaxID=2714954 RepID=UPI00146E2651|nr:M14 family zinc carboxypeptidase [Streptomyces sp. HNM0574]NLU70375.1 peptidase M28 [Streptomyces sp. HNM0574]